MDLKQEFWIDPGMFDDGVWIPIGSNGDDVAVLVAPLGNPKFQKFMEPHLRNYRRMNRMVPESIYEEAMAKFVLLSWKGIEDGGKILEPTEENRLKALRSYKIFQTQILQLAMDRANFRREQDAAEEKNSESGPSGSSGSVPTSRTLSK